MLILAFDTCFDAVSAAVARQQASGLAVLAERAEPRRVGHAERLLPMLAEVSAAAGIGFADVELIAVTEGPGTFTGVRTGIAAARALALATGRKAVGVGSLAAMAVAARACAGGATAGRPIAVAMAQRPGLVFFQLFGVDAIAIGAPLLLSPEACAARMPRQGSLIVGSAAVAVLAAAARIGTQAGLIEAEPRASAVALLAADVAADRPLRPVYLRAPDAKPQSGALPRAVS